ncbi:MAG: glutamine--tRNA ligase/YqeY domain fusion protein [Cyanobacteriota bacterium]
MSEIIKTTSTGENNCQQNNFARSGRNDFLRAIINEHLRSDKYGGKVITRFPPEPNGFLHIGHAKSICLNFGIANDYDGGICHLRFDDTDPTKEEVFYVNSIQEDIKWLGFDWGKNLFFASDYFEKLYNYAVKLIEMGKAYVCSLSDEEIKAYRGTVTEPGKESPYRNRPIEINLELFAKMKYGEYKDGEHVLRAKINMSSPNMKMRDPLLYRIRHANHYRLGDKWCIYPMYDFAHCLSDYIEKITHSICTLEFENNRELYDWILDELELKPPRPYQYEFARLNLNYTVMSKRLLLDLVDKKLVDGWNDPRLPTISGLRRRGYTPEAIRNFCDSIGIAKANSTVDMAQLEFAIRDDLNPKVPRVLCVLNPLKIIIENYPDNKTEMLEASYYPHDVPKEGSRPLAFSKEIYIERDDFMENPPDNYFRLAPGKEVRLRHAYIIKCEQIIKDDKTGDIIELRCSYDPETKSGEDSSGKKVKGTIHWVSADHSKNIEVRLYDRLFLDEFPGGIENSLNPDSLTVLNNCYIESSVAEAEPGCRFQFERHGYFYLEPESSTDTKLVFNRIVHLKDSWGKIAKQEETEEIIEKPAKKQPPKDLEAVQVKPEVKEMTPEIESRINRYQNEFNLSEDESIILARDYELSVFYENSIKKYNNPATIAKWIVNEMLRDLKEKTLSELAFGSSELAELVKLIDDGVITGNVAKDIYSEMVINGGKPSAIVETKGLKQISDPAKLEAIIHKIINQNPDNVEKFKSGKTNLFGFFVGQVMKETKGKANPQVVNELIKKILS